MLQVLLAVLHLLALPIGLPAVIGRARALGLVAREPQRETALRRAFAADALWGLAAMLWVATGLWRYLGATELSTAYYNANHLFRAKMALLALILLLELWPMATLIRWRIALRAGGAADAVARPATARALAAVSWVQLALALAMVVCASGMARGFGAPVAS